MYLSLLGFVISVQCCISMLLPCFVEAVAAADADAAAAAVVLRRRLLRSFFMITESVGCWVVKIATAAAAAFCVEMGAVALPQRGQT